MKFQDPSLKVYQVQVFCTVENPRIKSISEPYLSNDPLNYFQKNERH